jgi:putative addiction module component (TIGR02574 family)
MIKMQEILELSVEERILIAEQIWDSIDTNDIHLSTAQEKELDARLARYANGETKFFRWDQIKNELKNS